MQKLKRSINMGFRVNEEEQELIRRRMAQTKFSNLRAYLLKMAIDGRVITIDLTHVKECSRLLGNVSGNINQISRHANTYGTLYAEDMAKIQQQLDEVWAQQDKILKFLTKLAKVV
jgi:DNA mismatch repair ATPase MutL